MIQGRKNIILHNEPY